MLSMFRRKPTLARPRSQLCTAAQFREPDYVRWGKEYGFDPSVLHRKRWEFVYISRVAEDLGLLQPGRRALAFGVGCEPLASAFAARGVSVVATDAPADDANWSRHDEYAQGLKSVWREEAISWDRFTSLVEFRRVDMNDIPADLRAFDFLWSSCALEHLGTLKHGIDFILNAMECLTPGGVAIHTTEFNVSSNRRTCETGLVCLYRKQDIEALARTLEHMGHEVLPINFYAGNEPPDKHIDLPPFGDPHLKLQLTLDLTNYVTTSIGIAIRKRARGSR
jgi:2-polyprenyl-3-methyl-5-hydroxy-6-metoxy-1,4-benzoquinol methylase